MNKIMLPPCKAIYPPKCGDACGRFGTCEHYSPEGDFDALAAAVIIKEHCPDYPYVIGIYPKAFAPQKIKDNYMVMVRGIQGEGPTPTAALLDAINKFNEEAE